LGAYNGDIGIVESINMRDRSMVVRMDDRRLLYPAENLNELEIAYAITVHKSQGSEFPAVILPVAVYFMFVYGLHVMLPKGILQGILR